MNTTEDKSRWFTPSHRTRKEYLKDMIEKGEFVKGEDGLWRETDISGDWVLMHRQMQADLDFEIGSEDAVLRFLELFS